MTKQVLFVAGPGWASQGDFIENCRMFRDLKVQSLVLSPVKALSAEQSETLAAADFIVLRGPWTASPEEKVLATLWARHFDAYLSALKASNRSQKVMGFGRGALVLLLSKLFDQKLIAELEWDEFFKDKGPWESCMFLNSAERFLGLIQGRSLPRIEKIPGALGLEDWIKFSLKTVAWQFRSQFYLSFVDPFACADRSQLGNFGYEDLLELPTQSGIISSVFGVNL
jgi:hypothetical protein